uniref:cysteine-rich KTR domain-containing protein n=1 Tax=Anaerostipes hadrus TaxID=649756 RepID=UPI0036F2BCC9
MGATAPTAPHGRGNSCPICGNKTQTMIQEDIELKNFPLYCPKCKQQTLVNVKHFVVSVSIDSAN